MSDGIYVALSGAIAQSTALETTATNLANAAVDGYQRERPVFHEILSGAVTDRYHFTNTSGTALDTSVGEVRQTGQPLDVALPEGVYLAMSTDKGERYTRAGSLRVLDGFLANSHGTRVLGEDGAPISIPTGADVALTGTGEVVIDGATRTHLRLVRFDDAPALTHQGATLLASTPSSGTATPAEASIEVGAIEGSNAQVVTAMTDLVSTTRSFDAFERAIDAFREADRRVVSTVPGVS